MLHVKKAHSFKGWHFFLSGIKWYTFPTTHCRSTCLSRQCGKVFSVICSVLSTLQYLTRIPVRSSSSILAVGVKQSTVATLKTGKGVWGGGEGCWFGGELWFPLYMKSYLICLWLKLTGQRIQWATNMSRYYHSLLAKKVGIALIWFSEEIKTHPSMSPTD